MLHFLPLCQLFPLRQHCPHWVQTVDHLMPHIIYSTEFVILFRESALYAPQLKHKITVGQMTFLGTYGANPSLTNAQVNYKML